MNNDIMKRKAMFFLEKKVEVHINKLDRTFYNGFIIRISDNYLELNDRKLGIVPVFWDEMNGDSITEYREERV